MKTRARDTSGAFGSEPAPMTAAPLLLLSLLFLLPGCADTARLLIFLERPSGAMDPLKDRRLAKFSLRLVQGGRSTDQEAFTGGVGDLEVGDVPVGDPLDLRLAGRSAGGLMVGLGQVLDLVVSDTKDTAIAVKFRKPLGYVAGQLQVQALDAAAESGGTLELKSLPIGGGSDVASLINGVMVLVVSNTTLIPVRTLDHVTLPTVKLKAPGSCVVVSPDNREALICHPTNKSVGTVDLTGVGVGTASESTTAVGGTPSRITFSRDRSKAVVLLGGLSSADSCAGAAASKLTELPLQGGKASAASSLDRPVADIAMDPGDGSLLLALPCEGKLRRLRGGVNTGEVKVPKVQDIAVADRDIVVMGQASGLPVRGQAMLFSHNSSGLGGFGAPRTLTFDLKPVTIKLTSSGTTSGYFSWSSEPKALSVFDLEISPDSQRAIALFRADFSSKMSFDTCTYRSSLKATGYLLIDLASSSVLVQRFTRLTFSDCHANCVVNPQGKRLTDTKTCANEVKRVLKKDKLLISDTAEFDPSGATLLFGGS